MKLRCRKQFGQDQRDVVSVQSIESSAEEGGRDPLGFGRKGLGVGEARGVIDADMREVPARRGCGFPAHARGSGV